MDGTDRSAEREGSAYADRSITAGRDPDSKAKHRIFISYSGAQRDFVDGLHRAFNRHDRDPFYDVKRSCVSVGKEVQKTIFSAIEGCEVGVLILTEDFFSRTEWPMLELVAMVRELKKQNARITIIPVFYRTSWEKCSNNTSERIAKWEEWALKNEGEKDERMRIDVEKWKQALKSVWEIKGVNMPDGTLDGDFHEEIVKVVSQHVPPETRVDDSFIVGNACEVVLKVVRGQPMDQERRVVGLHGMLGTGKSTLCMALCNKLCTEYHDRVCHVDIEESGNGEALLRNVLKKLSDLSSELLDECGEGELYKHLQNVKIKNTVFLAIDNVKGSSQKEFPLTRALMETPLGEGSVVLVTSPSLEILSVTLGIPASDCVEMPDLSEDDAKDLFWTNAAPRNTPRDECNEELLRECIRKCLLKKGCEEDWHYHPMALKVLGQQLRNTYGYNPGRWILELDRIPAVHEFNLERKLEHPVFSIFKMSFDSLLPEDQRLFMDIALYLPEPESVPSRFLRGKDNRLMLVKPERQDAIFPVADWLRMAEGSSADELQRQLEGLKRKALLQSVDGRMIRMHDLWREFAKYISRNAQLGYLNGPFEQLGMLQTSQNVRSICSGFTGPMTVDLKTLVPNVGVLKTAGFPPGSMMDMTSLNNLRSLEVICERWENLKTDTDGVDDDDDDHSDDDDMERLRKKLQADYNKFEDSSIKSMGDHCGRTSICFKNYEKSTIASSHDELKRLHDAVPEMCISDKKKCHLEMERSVSDKILPRVSFWNGLLSDFKKGVYKILYHDYAKELVVIMNRQKFIRPKIMVAIVRDHQKGLLAKLSEVSEDYLKRLEKNVSERLEANRNSGSSDGRTCSINVPALDDGLDGHRCLIAKTADNLEGWGELIKDHLNSFAAKIKEVRDDQLKTLKSTTHVGGSSRVINIGSKIVPLQHLPFRWAAPSHIPLPIRGLQTLVNLAFLRCWNVAPSACMEEIEVLTNLEVLDLSGFRGDKLPNFSKLTKLRYLVLRECDSVREINLKNLRKLTQLDVQYMYSARTLDVSGCSKLERVWGLGSLACLEVLDISGCGRLRELPMLRRCQELREFRMRDCRRIRSLPGVRYLNRLQKLDITGCKSISESLDLRCNVDLVELQCKGCEKLAEVCLTEQACTNLKVMEVDFSTTVTLRAGEGTGECVDEIDEEDGYKYFYMNPENNSNGPLCPWWLQNVPGVETWEHVVVVEAAIEGLELADDVSHSGDPARLDENAATTSENCEELVDNALTEQELRAKALSLAEAAKSQGNSLYAAGKYSEALECYARASEGVASDPSANELRAQCYANRAMCEIKLKNYTGAVTESTKALEINMNYVKALMRRALATENLDKCEEALSDFKKALELEPSNNEVRRNIDRLERREELRRIGKLKDLQGS